MALSDNLQGWWCPSLDTSGNGTTTLTDLTGNGKNGTLTNMDAGTDWVTDTDNGGVRALAFSGTKHVDLGSAKSLLDNAGEWSVSSWHRPDQEGASFRASPFGDTLLVTSAFPTLRYASGQVQVFAGDGSSLWLAGSVAGTPSTDWQLVTLTYDGTDVKLYLQGSLAATFNEPNNSVVGNLLWLGGFRSGSARTFTGLHDGFAIWDSAKTDAEVASLYNGGRSLNLLASGGGDNIAHVLASMQQQQESVVVL